MEASMVKALATSTAAILVFILGSKLFYHLWWKPKLLEKYLRQQGIRGTSYKLVYGDNTIIKKMTIEAWSNPMYLNHSIVQRVNPFLHQMVQTYGNLCMCWIGTKPRLIIGKAELVKLILIDKDGHFQKPPQNPLVDLLTKGVSTLEGEKWAKRRRIITPAFHHEKLQGMMPEFLRSCRGLIDQWRKLVVGLEGSSVEIDIKQEVQNLSSDVIARTAFGSSFEEGKKIFELQKEQAVLVNEAYQGLYLPGFRFLPTKKNRKRYKLDLEIRKMLEDIIRKKQMAIQEGGESSNGDLLGLLLLQCKEKMDNHLTIEDVIEECKLFYYVGQETTANWLTWTLILLAIHQDWQHKARQEVLQICGNSPPDVQTINRLKIITMVLYEVLRLYPPVSHLFRYAIKTAEIGGISIPPGVEVFLPITLLHHASECWGDEAEEFKPERFKAADDDDDDDDDEECGSNKATSSSSSSSSKFRAFYPFGWGPRNCLGQSFAILEAKLAMAMILQNFSFKLSPSYVHAPHTIITLQPQHGAPIILDQI